MVYGDEEWQWSHPSISAMIGETFESITKNEYEILFNGREDVFKMYHEQDCCERVWLEEIIGDLDDLVGAPIITAEEVTNQGDTPDGKDFCTWTFYNFATIKGYVTLRWCGTSNGYYSERVDLYRYKRGS